MLNHPIIYTMLTLAFFTVALFPDLISCLVRFNRPFNDASRPKAICHKNLTSLIVEPQINYQQRCVALNYPFHCLDIKLPYNSTILPDYIPDIDIKSFEDVQLYLQRWQGARKLPKCWPVLQLALCSTLMPQCEEDHQTGQAIRIYPSNVDICNDLVNKSECQFVKRQFDLPSLFNCNDTDLYAKNCTNELRGQKLSFTKPSCQYPLVASLDENSQFKDIGGCALHCKFPISNPNDQYYIYYLIVFASIAGILSSIFATLLFRVNRKKGKISPLAKVIRICVMCQLLSYCGWSLQILSNDDIACKADGSPIYGLPLVANACVLSFILTYLPGLTSLFWCAYFGKLCNEKISGNKTKASDDVESNRSLTILNHGIPLALFISVAFLGHIDGHGLYGICTVGQQSVLIKSFFVLIPLIIGTIYGNFYFIKIIFKLSQVRSKKPSIRRNLLRFSALSILTLLQVSTTIANYFYDFTNRDKWIDSIDRFVACSLNLNDDMGSVDSGRECIIDTKPLVHLYYLEIFSTLGVGIVIASWACCDSNFRGLKRRTIDLLEDNKDRAWRVRNYLYENNRAPSIDAKETFHDLIDMTNESNNINNQKMRIIEPDTPSSLASTNLSIALNTENGSTATGHYIPRAIRNTNGKSYKSSRDVVNECKLQSLVLNGQVQAPLVAPDPNFIAQIISMGQIMQRFNPPDLEEFNSDPGKQPTFNHGVCTLGE